MRLNLWASRGNPKCRFFTFKQLLSVTFGGRQISQYAERILNKTAKAINETFAGLKLMLQGFRIHFVWHPNIKGIESTS